MIFFSILIALIYAFVNQLFGLILLKPFAGKIKDNSALATLATAFLIGSGMLSGIWTILGIIGWLKFFGILAILVIIIIFSFFVWKDFWNLQKSVFYSFLKFFRSLSLFWRAIFVLLCFLLVIFGAGAVILPPLGDAEGFYMVLPKITAYLGRLIPQPNYDRVSQIGLLGEMHYTVLISLFHWTAAKFFVWFNVLAVIGLIISISSLAGLKNVGKIIVLAIIFTSPTFTNFITDGKVDIFGAAFGLAAYYWLLKADKNQLIALGLTGMFAGFAVMAKLSNILVIIPAIIFVVIWNNFHNFRKVFRTGQIVKKSFISLIIIGSFFIVVLLPHLVKNAILFGNPLAMSLSINKPNEWSKPVWSQPNLSPAALKVNSIPSEPSHPEPSHPEPLHPEPSSSESLHIAKVDFPEKTVINYEKIIRPETVEKLKPVLKTVERIIYYILTAPFAFTFWEFPGKGGNLSVLVLIFLPLIFIYRSKNLLAKQILAMSLSGIIIWLIVRSSAITPRYILATLLLFIPVLAYGAEKIVLDKKISVSKALIMAAISLILLSFILGNVKMLEKFINVATGKQNEEAYFGPNYSGLSYLNGVAGRTDRVFFLGYSTFFMKPELIVNMNTNKEMLDFINLRTDTHWQYLLDHKFKYIILQKSSQLPVVMHMQTREIPENISIKSIYSDANIDIFELAYK